MTPFLGDSAPHNVLCCGVFLACASFFSLFRGCYTNKLPLRRDICICVTKLLAVVMLHSAKESCEPFSSEGWLYCLCGLLFDFFFSFLCLLNAHTAALYDVWTFTVKLHTQYIMNSYHIQYEEGSALFTDILPALFVITF